MWAPAGVTEHPSPQRCPTPREPPPLALCGLGVRDPPKARDFRPLTPWKDHNRPHLDQPQYDPRPWGPDTTPGSLPGSPGVAGAVQLQKPGHGRRRREERAGRTEEGTCGEDPASLNPPRTCADSCSRGKPGGLPSAWTRLRREDVKEQSSWKSPHGSCSSCTQAGAGLAWGAGAASCLD